MRVFLSWSGDRSRRLAEALRDWLPSVLQSVEPWLSAVDISKGARWSTALTDALKQTDAGVICLTRENSQAGWLLFEAGAISNIPSGAFVAVYLLDHRVSDVSGPLAQFQCTEATRDDTFRLVSALNTIDRSPLSEQRLHSAFEVWWPQLDAHLAAIRATAPEPQASRSMVDKLDEILELIRGLASTFQPAVPPLVATAPDTAQPRDVKRAPAQGHRPAVFIGSSTEGLHVARAIQENLDEVADCTIWDQDVFQPSRTFIETLVDVSAKHEFAVVVLTPDDVLEKRGEGENARSRGVDNGRANFTLKLVRPGFGPAAELPTSLPARRRHAGCNSPLGSANVIGGNRRAASASARETGRTA